MVVNGGMQWHESQSVFLFEHVCDFFIARLGNQTRNHWEPASTKNWEKRPRFQMSGRSSSCRITARFIHGRQPTLWLPSGDGRWRHGVGPGNLLVTHWILRLLSRQNETSEAWWKHESRRCVWYGQEFWGCFLYFYNTKHHFCLLRPSWSWVLTFFLYHTFTILVGN